MGFVAGVHLLPATGEFTYDTVAYQGARLAQAASAINTYFAPGGAKTDFSYAIDQLQAAHPECTTVSVLSAWFGSSTNAAACQIYPSTTYLGGSFSRLGGGADNWRVSGLTQNSAGVIPLPQSGGSFSYGGTPSDQSLVRCIRDLKSRGFRVIFYPFVLMTAAGLPWRGRITYGPDLTAAAASAVGAFLGTASASMFTPDAVNLTVGFSGSPTDFSWRRMILHYAWLCTIAGGVDLFLIGSELRGLESIRGPAWTPAGGVDAFGNATWDYPFVAGLSALAQDVRSVFDNQGLTKNPVTQKNLIAYSADWSAWMGYQHPGANGQWPHLDSLWASANIDLVGFDNYLPLSDWITGDAGLDAINWQATAPAGPWPPAPSTMNGLGQSGAPTIYSKPYLKANIEGGENFSWFYRNSNNLGAGLDPYGADQIVSRPEGDRLTQARNPFSPGQELLANKQFRWWWNNPHRAVYDNGDGSGWAPHGPQTQWRPQIKSIAFIEYGVAATDKGSNQPNVFFDPRSTESFTPYWSVWDRISGGGLAPHRDDTIALLMLQAIYEYWNVDGHNQTSGAGIPLIQFTFSCIWNWDARPFPAFPILSAVWGDAGNWPFGQWLTGRGPATPPLAPSSPPALGPYAYFPVLPSVGWSTLTRARFDTNLAEHVSGRSSRRSAFVSALYDVELVYEILRADAAYLELQTLAGFFAQMRGAGSPFWLAPPGQANLIGQTLGVGDGLTNIFPLTRSLGAYVEPVAGTSGVTAVYQNAAPISTGLYSVTTGLGPAIAFSTAPAAGQIISADFGVLWLCRFSEDIADLENFMAMLWSFRTVKLQTVRA